MSAGGSKNGLSGDDSGNHQRFSIQGRPKSPLVFEITGNSIPENHPVNSAVRKRKGASTVGLGLSDINQQFCSTMIGITFGGPSSSVTETTLQVCCSFEFCVYMYYYYLIEGSFRGFQQ